LPLALLRIGQSDFDSPATLDANYLRRTDAEIFAKPRPSKPSPASVAQLAVPETPAR
jgi:tRNA threonylcarbamoyladenosine biosynthesis protein TsaB